MNYVNKQAAKALKDAGFDVPVNSYYSGQRETYKIKYSSDLGNWNAYALPCSAPDFLTAADWIDMKSEGHIQLSFWNNSTVVYSGANGEHSKDFQIEDHRNTAILFALEELKKLKDDTK